MRSAEKFLLVAMGILLLTGAWFIGNYACRFLTARGYVIEDKYTILVDLILIILALVAIVGYAIYRWISRSVEDRTRRAIREGQNYTRAQVETSLGFWYYEQYLAETKSKEETDRIWAKLKKIQSRLAEGSKVKRQPRNNTSVEYLNRAIERTMKALEFTKELDEREYEELICVCKNNLAYYLAKRQEQGKAELGDRELARDYAKYVRNRVEKYPRRRATFIDTIDFVNQQFPDSD